jgi:hypothetical protein
MKIAFFSFPVEEYTDIQSGFLAAVFFICPSAVLTGEQKCKLRTEQVSQDKMK